MGKIHRIAGLRISRVTPTVGVDAEFVPGREVLPELEPAEDRLRRQKTHIFSSDTIALSHESAIEDVFDPNMREEHNDFTARMTVYVLNAIVMVFALPVGLALLCMNILGGENLRTTAHVMALTGVFMVLSTTEEGARLLSFI
ncbi:MAG: hypothetical protein KJO42_07690 [Silicimonas sp.]|nr:hypothetical protein [Silicimonas sp.]NND18260.1 hypothetical protein [Silicimonas sp.]NND41956.1 hypothetical protein [Silicimonas sp.]NNL73636.1 hypothetical protein [Silicimonas sp.]RZV98790.1 MAG: hypothetical protein EX266_16355 [Paracoccaceae bacterium]